MCLFLSLHMLNTNLLSVVLEFYFLYIFFCHTSTSTRLFLHVDRVTEELKVYLNSSCNGSLCVKLQSYDSVRDVLQKYVAKPGVKVWVGTEYTNYALYEVITPQVCLLAFVMIYCSSFYSLSVL